MSRDVQADPREAFAEKLVADTSSALEVFAIFLGVELGLYAALDEIGPAAPAELAGAAHIHERYAREWLEQQAVAGVLTVDDPRRAAGERRFRVPSAHRDTLLDADSPFHTVGLAQMVGGTARVLPRLLEAYRTGGGVPYADYGRELRDGIAATNRPMFLHDLADQWLPAMPDVHARLASEPRPRILDLGCGVGASTRALAGAYPRATVVGVDLDAESIDAARVAARTEGIEDRVDFRARDAAYVVADEAPFDLVTIFEALHDIGDPVGALRTARAATGGGGTVLVADERVADEFSPDGDLIERFNYGWSVTHCLPATMAESPVEANGTALRASTVRRWAAEAGFAGVRELDIDNPFWRFYRLTP
ncbi:MAG: class I SAM-dependent methyltransferase [Actinomycetes bacterium]